MVWWYLIRRPNHDCNISNCAAGQFWVEWFLLTSACHSVALSVQTIRVACWQQLPSGAAGDRPNADLLPLCWRRGGEQFGLGGEGEDKGSRRGGEMHDRFLSCLILTQRQRYSEVFLTFAPTFPQVKVLIYEIATFFYLPGNFYTL